MSVLIAPVRSADDIAEATRLARAFVAFLHARYPERAEMIDAYLRDQRFEEMLANFRAFFMPPDGECMLARLEGRAVGIVMLKPAAASGLCEMNRMFVAPGARGHGIGRALCEGLFARAREMGYREMRLDALDRHVEALPLYESLGFRPDPEPPAFALRDDGIVSLRRAL